MVKLWTTITKLAILQKLVIYIYAFFKIEVVEKPLHLV